MSPTSDVTFIWGSITISGFFTRCSAAFFGKLLLDNRAFNETGYLHSFIFAVLCFLSFDSVSFTREILGSTFLLLALNNLFREIEFKTPRDETIHNLGLFISLATLCVFSYVVFFVGAAILLLMFTRVEVRRFLLFIVGFLLFLANEYLEEKY